MAHPERIMAAKEALSARGTLLQGTYVFAIDNELTVTIGQTPFTAPDEIVLNSIATAVDLKQFADSLREFRQPVI